MLYIRVYESIDSYEFHAKDPYNRDWHLERSSAGCSEIDIDGGSSGNRGCEVDNLCFWKCR
ncbi:hypothetical protein SADUNF_Sadunf07G0113000 [Salix dunnii]|uniref:Uncharacterized protein n=1 Tax=Salix dunnii TaxID=1413687 RepID=A0A835MUB9_9ROSI|nr:hypothetical protein SADUNF_Sadunf07G0113000 [Salix dunnii]